MASFRFLLFFACTLTLLSVQSVSAQEQIDEDGAADCVSNPESEECQMRIDLLQRDVQKHTTSSTGSKQREETSAQLLKLEEERSELEIKIQHQRIALAQAEKIADESDELVESEVKKRASFYLIYAPDKDACIEVNSCADVSVYVDTKAQSYSWTNSVGTASDGYGRLKTTLETCDSSNKCQQFVVSDDTTDDIGDTCQIELLNYPKAYLHAAVDSAGDKNKGSLFAGYTFRRRRGVTESEKLHIYSFSRRRKDSRRREQVKITNKDRNYAVESTDPPRMSSEWSSWYFLNNGDKNDITAWDTWKCY